MATETQSTSTRVRELRADLEQESRGALTRAKAGIAIRAVLILFVGIYMSWMLGALSRLDAEEITRLAAATIEERLPDFRVQIRDYAIEMAPELTDQARDMLLEAPTHAREYLEGQLLGKTDELIARLETDIDLALGTVIEDQIALIAAESPGDTPEEHLDTLVLGLSDAFRVTLLEALDVMYLDYSDGIRKLDEQLEYLTSAAELTATEKIDKQLVEVWMVLVHRHQITSPDRIAEAISAKF